MKNLKSYLKEKVEELYEDGVEFYDLHYELFGEQITNWPEIIEEDMEEEDVIGKESLDMENFEWLSIDDDELEICCGGDWQTPMKLTIQLDYDRLVVANTENDYFENGLSKDEFNHILSI